MGNWIFKDQAPPPPVVLVPPLFDRPELADRSRMMESSYDLLFGKFARAKLFNDYFEEASYHLGRIVLQSTEDPRLDTTIVFRVPQGGASGGKLGYEASFRMQRNAHDPYTFWDATVGSSNVPLKFRVCAYDAQTGLGAFATAPLLSKKAVQMDDVKTVGFRYSTDVISAGFVTSPIDIAKGDVVDVMLHSKAWVVCKMGPITAGVQYKPSAGLGELRSTKWDDKKNWSVAVDYGTASKGPLKPSFNFGLEVLGDDKLIASYYQHLVVGRRVKNPFEQDSVVGITNYIDLGFEAETKLNVDEEFKEASNMRCAASWQVNKSVLLKAKGGTDNSTLAVCLKMWWQPAITFSFAISRDHLSSKTRWGFGARTENFGGVSYEQTDPNYVMLTSSKTQIAKGAFSRNRPVLQDDVDAGRAEKLPAELRPRGDIL